MNLRSLVLSTVACLALVACTDDEQHTTSSGSTGSGETPAEHVDLFACTAPPTCGPIYNHLGAEPASERECAARLIADGTPGSIYAEYTVSGAVGRAAFIVVLGDGTALVQEREEECTPGDCGTTSPVVWKASGPQRVCDVLGDDELEAACADGSTEGCFWDPWNYSGQDFENLGNCKEVEERGCEEVAGLVGAK